MDPSIVIYTQNYGCQVGTRADLPGVESDLFQSFTRLRTDFALDSYRLPHRFHRSHAHARAGPGGGGRIQATYNFDDRVAPSDRRIRYSMRDVATTALPCYRYHVPAYTDFTRLFTGFILAALYA